MNNWNKFLSTALKGIKWFSSSIDNHTSGASGRKLTAVTFMALIIWGQYTFVDAKMWYDVLVVYVVCILILLGVVTVEQIIKFKSGSSSTTTTEKEMVTEKSTETFKETTNEPK